MSDTVDGTPHLWTEPTVYQPWTINLWQAIAQRYANETAVAGYDLLDEPLLSESNPTSDGQPCETFYVQVTAAIRTADKNHILFACGTAWCGSTAGVKAILPAWDNNMVLVFHKYWDKNNTDSIQGYLDIRNQNNIPIWNGETGENTNAWAKGMLILWLQTTLAGVGGRSRKLMGLLATPGITPNLTTLPSRQSTAKC